MIPIKFAEIHTPLFLGRKNHGVKLNDGTAGLVLGYEPSEDALYAWFNGEKGKIGSYSVVIPHNADDLPGDIPKRGQKLTESGFIHTPSPAPRGKIKAQVGGPMDHVHAGPGAGKARN